MIVLHALRVIFVLKQQCCLLFALLATFARLLPTSHSLALPARSEILLCLQIPMIACNVHQDFTVTVVHHLVRVGDALLDSIVQGVLLHQLHPCLFALREASARKEQIFPKRVLLEHSTTKLNLEIL